jgi:ribonuclease BN (tRNA processing enzyme)
MGSQIENVPEDAVVINVNHGYNHPKNGILFFRIHYKNRSLVIATDTEGYVGDDQKLIKFTQEADLLVHDAEYDEHEYAQDFIVRQGWGHSTWRMAVNVAKAAQVKHLVLTHHSPGHPDAYLEQMLSKVQAVFPNAVLAQEGATLEVE